MVPQSTPTATPSPTEKKRSKGSSRTAEDALQWAVGEGIGEYLSLTGPSGEVELGKVRCNLCGSWVSFKTDVLRDHCLGRKQKDGVRKPGFHAQKVERLRAEAPPPQPESAPASTPPTIVVNVTTPSKSQSESPPAKKHKPDSSLLSMISKGNAAEMFTKDVTRAFSSVFFWCSMEKGLRPYHLR